MMLNNTLCTSIPLVGGGKRYALHFHIALERDTPCTSIMLPVKMDTPCTSLAASAFLPVVICLSLALAFWNQVQSGTIGHVVTVSQALSSYGIKHGIESAVSKAFWRDISGFYNQIVEISQRSISYLFLAKPV
jgi:hypothetical protein